MKTFFQSAFILITVLLTATGADQVVYAQVGETVTLKPSGKHKANKHYLSWMNQDRELAWRNPLGGSGLSKDLNENWKDMLSLSGDSLIIKNIQLQHFGSFVFRWTENHARFDKEVFQLLLLQLTASAPSPLLSEDSPSLTCTADSPQNHIRPRIHWLNPQGEKMQTNPVRVKAAGQHTGQWTCVVTVKQEEHKGKISVTVVDLSPGPPGPLYTSKNLHLSIPCSIPSYISWEQIKAKGLQEVHWDFFQAKPGTGLISDDPQRLYSLSLEDPPTWKADRSRGLTPVADLKKGNLSLTKRVTGEVDRGDYVCTLKFNNSVTLSRTVHINVLQIISFPGTDLISGQPVNLTCSLGHPLPSDMQLKWIPPEQSTRMSLTSDRLIIPEVGTGDAGRWKCELWQGTTLLTSTVTLLKIEFKLSMWMLVIICSATVIVLLLVLVVILCRRRQQRMRHLRHRLCRCKNPKPKGFYRT